MGRSHGSRILATVRSRPPPPAGTGIVRPRRRVLLITSYFDVDTEIGGVRPRAYADYLPALGWDVLVVTAGDPADDVSGPGVTVRHAAVGSAIAAARRRTGPGRVGGELAGLVPERLAWGLRAARLAVRVGRVWRPDVVLSSAPSHVANLAAWHVARSLRVPWVAELRDLWGRNPFRAGTRLRRLPDVLLERFAFRRVAGLVTVSEPLADVLRADHPHASVTAIRTGIDPALVAPAGMPLDDHFCLLYAGRLYLGHRDLASVLVPLRTAADRGLVDLAVTRLHVLLLDPLPAATAALVRQLGLDPVVEVEYRVPREQVIERQRRAQLLLHLRWDAAHEAGIITGKIYEYLAARRPILSTGRYRDVAVELLEATGAGRATTSHDEAVEALGRAFEAWRRTGAVPFDASDAELRRLDLRGTAESMASVLESAVSRTR